MAGRIDVTAFCPDIPEDASADEKIRILQNALMEIRMQISFSMGHIRVQDMNASAVEEILSSAEGRIVTGVRAAKRWSEYGDGEKIARGSLVWYEGVLWECTEKVSKWDYLAPETTAGAGSWKKVS